jgi:hypothetical protein
MPSPLLVHVCPRHPPPQVVKNLSRFRRNTGMHRLALEVIAHSMEAHELAGLLKEFQKVRWRETMRQQARRRRRWERRCAAA